MEVGAYENGFATLAKSIFLPLVITRKNLIDFIDRHLENQYTCFLNAIINRTRNE